MDNSGLASAVTQWSHAAWGVHYLGYIHNSGVRLCIPKESTGDVLSIHTLP